MTPRDVGGLREPWEFPPVGRDLHSLIRSGPELAMAGQPQKSKADVTRNTEPTLFVVDGDRAARELFRTLATSVSLRVATYSSARMFLRAYNPNRPGCLVTEVRTGSMSGLDLQKEMLARNHYLPIIFVTAYGDIPTAVQALKAGALDFIEKPISPQLFLDRAHHAINSDRTDRQRRADQEELAACLARLTLREREILELLVAGLPHSVIADHVKLSVKTVGFHLTNLRHKVGTRSLASLVRMVAQANGTFSVGSGGNAAIGADDRS